VSLVAAVAAVEAMAGMTAEAVVVQPEVAVATVVAAMADM
jgi:hypothetical protein